MSEQSKALRLADALYVGEISYTGMCQAAAELRRLHQSEREGWRYADELNLERQRLNALNQELTENLEKKSVAIQRIWKERDELRKVNQELLEALKLARSIIGHPDDAHSRHIAAVIAKAEAA